VSRRRAVVAILFALTLVLMSSTGEARDRSGETCTSYTTAGGTTIEDCRDKTGHTTHCESTTSSGGTTRTQCR
jgi:hypothetical protein